MSFFHISRKVALPIAFLIAGMCIVLAMWFAHTVYTQANTVDPYIEAEQVLNTLTDTEYQKYFVEYIDVFFRRDGMNGLINRVEKDLAEGQITMFVCHSLAHDIGHYGGYQDHFGDVEDFLSKKNLDFCGSGFMHGIEAQLAAEPYPSNIDKLYAFCKMTMPFKPYYGGCYHGAGHSFMEITRTVPEALAQCEFLKTDEEMQTVEHCYRGVYSENANLMMQSGNTPEDLFAYCSAQEGVMQEFCAQELNGLELPADVSNEGVGEYVLVCMNPEYGEAIQRGCLRSVAGVAMDRVVGQGITPVPASVIFDLPQEHMRDYIHASYGAFIKSSAYDPSLTFEPFCSSFADPETQEYCKGLRLN